LSQAQNVWSGAGPPCPLLLGFLFFPPTPPFQVTKPPKPPPLCGGDGCHCLVGGWGSPKETFCFFVCLVPGPEGGFLGPLNGVVFLFGWGTDGGLPGGSAGPVSLAVWQKKKNSFQNSPLGGVTYFFRACFFFPVLKPTTTNRFLFFGRDCTKNGQGVWGGTPRGVESNPPGWVTTSTNCVRGTKKRCRGRFRGEPTQKTNPGFGAGLYPNQPGWGGTRGEKTG